MPIICTIINSTALIWGGVVDCKRREIPNLVPMILLATGLACGNIRWRILFLLAAALVLWLSWIITKEEIPGGDCKLFCALAFSAGLPSLLGIMLCASLGMLFVGKVMCKSMPRSFPFCTFVAPAYLILSLYFLT